MTDLTGHKLEDFGQQVFTRMGLESVSRLNQVRLIEMHPDGPYTEDEHIEFDYLISYGNTCLIGEITGRSTPRDIERKYSQFRRHYGIVTGLTFDECMWRLLGVPDERLCAFREITEFRGFFIATRVQRFDVDLREAPSLARFYKVDWDLLEQYAACIGQYARFPFLRLFDIGGERARHRLILQEDAHSLLRTPNKKIASGDIGLADLYTFEASPYELLPMANVYRRDMLPDLSAASGAKYQRPLIQDKLDAIRENLLVDRDFIFPNSILVVLSSECRYNPQDRTLQIPETHGTISVIDGQHRLFSYADENVRNRLGDDCKIMVTAIQFRGADDEAIQRYSAKTFIEINMNQTRVRPTHLDAIAYEILRQTYPRAIAAQIILRANERRNSRLYGLFDTNQTSLGVIQTTTVLSALKTITRLDYIRGLQNAQRGSRARRRRGYQNLFEVDTIHELSEADVLIERGVVCFERYFNLVANVFYHDWPERGQTKNSSLEFAKMVAGFVRLLWQFIIEGLDWESIQTELENVRTHVMQLWGMQEYNEILFDPTHQDIPDAQPSTTDDYRFLNSNRTAPTSIQQMVAHRRRP
jgi:DGQHR domain-containing protein